MDERRYACEICCTIITLLFIGTLADKLYGAADSKSTPIQTAKLSVSEKFTIALDICMAVVYLHGGQVKIIHGDLKPANILFDDHGRAKLTDFGLAHITRTDAGVRSKGGTAVYMVILSCCFRN